MSKWLDADHFLVIIYYLKERRSRQVGDKLCVCRKVKRKEWNEGVFRSTGRGPFIQASSRVPTCCSLESSPDYRNSNHQESQGKL